jgi:hypothetical protein
LKYNGVTIDTVYSPIYAVTNGSNYNCNNGKWLVYPFDNSWNIGAPDTLNVVVQNPVNSDEVEITSSLIGGTYTEGTNTTFIVEATNAIDYEWQLSYDGSNWQPVLFGPNADSLNLYFQPSSNSNFSLRVIARSFCDADTSEIVQINVEPNSVKEFENNFSLNITPNPNNGLFHIAVENLNSNSTVNIVVTDVIGRIIKSKQYLNNNERFNAAINIENEPAGIYLLQVNIESVQKSLRIVKH